MGGEGSLFDPERRVVTDLFGTTLYPETWLIDSQGVIRVRVDGARDWSRPVALEVIDMITRPVGCNIEFFGGKPLGPQGALCQVLAP